MSNPTAIDLFAGCGGTTQGLKNAGFHVLAAVEIDELAAATYSLNHPDTTVSLGDIRDVDPTTLREQLRLRPGELTLLSACPPCQGFSSMRTLNGGKRVRDQRNSLLNEITRFAAEFQPRFVVLENVPKVAKSYLLRSLRADLHRLGYSTRSDVVDAADFGVPQRRRRLLLLAAAKEDLCQWRPRKQQRITVREAIGGLPAPGGSDSLHVSLERRSERIRALIHAVPQDGGSRADAGLEYRLPCHDRCDGFKDVYGRMRWDEVSPTITGGCLNPSKGRFLHPTENRAITMREAALLQSFPATYTYSLDKGRYAVATMIGNAVPPALMRAYASAALRTGGADV